MKDVPHQYDGIAATTLMRTYSGNRGTHGYLAPEVINAKIARPACTAYEHLGCLHCTFGNLE